MAKYVASGETVHYGPSDPSGLNPYTIEHAIVFACGTQGVNKSASRDLPDKF